MSKFETALDDIMEDLIVGHNFNYAREALLQAHNQAVEEATGKSAATALDRPVNDMLGSRYVKN